MCDVCVPVWSYVDISQQRPFSVKLYPEEEVIYNKIILIYRWLCKTNSNQVCVCVWCVCVCVCVWCV